MKTHNFVLAMLIILICALSVSGQSFTVAVNPVSEDSAKIYNDEVAEFEVVIKNYNSFEDKYLIYSMDPSWIIVRDSPSFVISAGEEKTFIIGIDPTTAIAKSGIYSLKLDIKSTMTEEIISNNQEILIKSEVYREFKPAVSVRAIIGDEYIVDSRDQVDLQITLVNRNALDIPKLTVFVSNEFFEETYETALSPNSEIIKILSYDIDSITSPQLDTLKVKVYYEGREITDKRIEYNIQENKLTLTRDSSDDSKLLYSEYFVNLSNLGNVETTETFSFPLNKFQNLFTNVIFDGDYVYSDVSSGLEFSVTLNPGDSVSVTIVTDYQATVYSILSVLLIIGIILALYYGLRSPILVTKKATVVAEKDGGTSEIKILLNIRNRTNKILENISVVDRIPDITEIEDEFSLGTLRPTRIIKNSKKGTLIKWDFPTVEGYEERLITYRIHSKLGILGSFTLPASIVKFEMPNGSKRAIKSQPVQKD